MFGSGTLISPHPFRNDNRAAKTGSKTSICAYLFLSLSEHPLSLHLPPRIGLVN